MDKTPQPRDIAGSPEEEPAAVLTRSRYTMARWAKIAIVIIVFAGIAILVSSNLSDSFQREKQKRTMKDMRTIAVAWEARATDLNRYNAAGALTLPPVSVAPDELHRNLAPRYIASVPAVDAWGHPYTFHVDVAFAGRNVAETYAIRSFGRDGKAGPLLEGATADFDCDIVFVEGSFVMYPGGRSH